MDEGKKHEIRCYFNYLVDKIKDKERAIVVLSIVFNTLTKEKLTEIIEEKRRVI
jgi:hypothetical protein